VQLTPNIVEMTVSELADLTAFGGDEFSYLVVTNDGSAFPAGWSMDDYRERSDDHPIIGAYYTTRRSRPEAGELDIWVVLHDHPTGVAAVLQTAEHRAWPGSSPNPSTATRAPFIDPTRGRSAGHALPADTAASSERLPWTFLTVDHEGIGPQLHQHYRLERSDDEREVGTELCEQFVVAAVTEPDDQQSTRRALQQVRLTEVAVLADHHPIFGISEPGEVIVRGSVSARELRRVQRIVAGLDERSGNTSRKLCASTRNLKQHPAV
jgi:hypothetical protein